MLKTPSAFVRHASFCLLGLLLLSSSASAAAIGFDDLATGTTVTDQYLAQGVSFSQGIVTSLPSGNKVLQVSDPTTPHMDLFFTDPVYSFSSKVFEFNLDLPPDTDEAPPPDAPPASDVKPDASVYPILHFSDGTTSELEVVHALDSWKELAFTSTKPVASFQLNGHYEGDTAVYFALDDVSFSSAVVTPEPASAGLLLAGLPWVVRLRRKKQ